MGTQRAEKVMGIGDLACVIPKERVGGVVGEKAYAQNKCDQEKNDAPYFLPDGFDGPLRLGFFLRFLAQ